MPRHRSCTVPENPLEFDDSRDPTGFPGAGEINAKYIIWRVVGTSEARKIIDFFTPEWYAMENIEEMEIDAMVNGKKIYYSISEVCAQTGLEPHVLRYWESEFSQLRPKKNRAGNRAYRDKDIEVIRFIRHLLYEEKFTIPGAKKKLAELRPIDGETVTIDSVFRTMPKNGSADDMKKELEEILSLLMH